MTVDADFDKKLSQLEIDVSAIKEEQAAMNIRSPKSRSPRSPRSPSSGKPGGYAEMMQEINDRLQTVGFAKRNIQIEERLNRFFP